MEDGNACLSLRQISTLNAKDRLRFVRNLKAKDKPDGFVTPSMVVRWPGASEVQVSRELLTKVCACGAHFDVEKAKAHKYDVCPQCRYITRECVHCGSLFVIQMRVLRAEKAVLCPVCGGENEGIQRKDITGFSPKSRLALMRQMNMLRKDVLNVNFVTLTFDDGFLIRDEGIPDAKAYLKAFELRFRRRFPGASYAWKMEVIDRKSGLYPGRLCPHFHLLSFNVPTGVLRAFVRDNWPEIIGGTPESLKVNAHEKVVTPCVNRKHILGYAAKGIGAVVSAELAKDIQTSSGLGAPGRWWGITNRDAFKELQADEDPEELNDNDCIHLFRFFRSFTRGARVHKYLRACEKAEKAKRAQPKPPGARKTYQVRSACCFIDSDEFWRVLPKILGSTGPWYFVSSGRDYNKAFWLEKGHPGARIDFQECARQAESTRAKSLTRQARGMLKKTGRLVPA